MVSGYSSTNGPRSLGNSNTRITLTVARQKWVGQLISVWQHSVGAYDKAPPDLFEMRETPEHSGQKFLFEREQRQRPILLIQKKSIC